MRKTSTGISALVRRNVGARSVTRVDLTRARDLLLLIFDHLVPLREPTRNARDREEHGEHVGGEAHRFVDEARVEVDVRVELARDEVVLGERDAFELERDVEKRILAGDLE